MKNFTVAEKNIIKARRAIYSPYGVFYEIEFSGKDNLDALCIILEKLRVELKEVKDEGFSLLLPYDAPVNWNELKNFPVVYPQK